MDCYETDSDEEILERILDLPLQKQCSKKLFSIPEVTEEEDEEDDRSPHIVSKKPHCHMESQKYLYENSHKAFSRKPGPTSCSNLPTETPMKASAVNDKNMECGEDCVFVDDEDFCPKSKSFYQSPSDIRPPVSDTQLWKTKRNSCDADKACCSTEPNRKKQNDSREHCSRMSANSNQGGVYNSRSYKLKEPVSCAPPRDTSQTNHKSSKNKLSRNSQRRHRLGSTNCKPKAPSSFSSRHLEIDVEYDTEEEDEPSFPAHNSSRATADLWKDDSQTDREGWSESSDYSEPIQCTRRKNDVKRPDKEHSTGEYVKGTPSLPHTGLSPLSCSKDDPVTRAASSRSMRSVRCDGKVMLESPMLPSSPGFLVPYVVAVALLVASPLLSICSEKPGG